MPERPNLIYWDSCVFLSYIDGDLDRLRHLDAILYEVSNSNGSKIITSAFSKVEVAFSSRDGQAYLDGEIERQIDLLWNDPSIEVVEFHDYIALEARSLMRRAVLDGYTLKPADATHLASAKYIQASVLHTYDKKLYKFSNYIGCEICEPIAQQPRMPI